MTNVKPQELNYDHYTTNKYDRDIVNSIPHHKELHEKIYEFVSSNFRKTANLNILELGVGTGITTRIIKNILPSVSFDLVDFSKQMLSGAKKRLGEKNIKYIFGDYSKIKFNKKYDIVVSVVGVHHQTNKGKIKLFKKIYSLLKPKGVFIFGDLVTYKSEYKSAYNNALHFHHLVEKSTDKKTLEEWAHHHQYLNMLAPVEDQIKWLEDLGFKVKILILKTNTALLICRK